MNGGRFGRNRDFRVKPKFELILLATGEQANHGQVDDPVDPGVGSRRLDIEECQGSI